MLFIIGKLTFLALAFGIPLLFHPLRVVALFYGVTTAVAAVVLSVVFQLAHCVEGAEFPLPETDTGSMETPWAIHRVESSLDFARHSRAAAWLPGDLNFQIEHHLFPRICQVNYPAISRLVEATGREFGV